MKSGFVYFLFLLAALPQLRAGELSAEGEAAIQKSQPGEILQLPELSRLRRRMPIIATTALPTPGPALLVSDMPEYLGRGSGSTALLESLQPGAYRLYLYHVPGTKGSPMEVQAELQNTSKADLHVEFLRAAFVPPGTDYPRMGIEGLMQFLSKPLHPAPLTISPNKVRDVCFFQMASDPQLDHAIVEFKIDQPAELGVTHRSPVADDPRTARELSPYTWPHSGEKQSGAGRGLFPTSEIAVTNKDAFDTATGAQRLVLADGRVEPWITGTDGLSGNIVVTNKGNYGVVYRVHLACTSSDGRNFALLIGPPGRGDRETRPMAAVKISDGLSPGGWREIAATRKQAPEPGAWAIVQKFAAPARGTTNFVEMIYSPPGGSSLPTAVVLVPYQP